MAGSMLVRVLRTRGGRVLAGLALAATTTALVVVFAQSTEQRSWDSARRVVEQRVQSGKSVSVRVAYALPDGSAQVATLPSNGPARYPGDEVVVRYDLEDGRVVGAALADNDQAHLLSAGFFGLMTLSGAFVNFLAWRPEKRPRT